MPQNSHNPRLCPSFSWGSFPLWPRSARRIFLRRRLWFGSILGMLLGSRFGTGGNFHIPGSVAWAGGGPIHMTDRLEVEGSDGMCTIIQRLNLARTTKLFKDTSILVRSANLPSNDFDTSGLNSDQLELRWSRWKNHCCLLDNCSRSYAQ